MPSELKSIIELLGFTPSPWHDYISPERHKCWIGSKAGEPYYVAEVIGRNRTLEKLEANTKLIAAAPEMLERDIKFREYLFNAIDASMKLGDTGMVYALRGVWEEFDFTPDEKATGKSWEDIKEIISAE